MRLRCLILCFVLGAAPLAAQFPISTSTGIHPGTVSIQTPLGPALEARIRQRLDDLCPIEGEISPLAGFYVPDVKLRCVTSPSTEDEPKAPEEGGGNNQLVEAKRRLDGGIDAIVYPDSWETVGTGLLGSACGPWSYHATLDSAVSQAPGTLSLWPETGDPTRGVFTGTLPIAARLYLENAGLGLTYDLPLELDVPLRGSWTAPPFAPGAPSSSASNLSLYVWPLELWRIHRPDCWEEEALWIDGEVVTLSCDQCVARIPPALPGTPPSCS